MKKECPDCNNKMIEVNAAVLENGHIVKRMYPKEEPELILGKQYRECRFYCTHCKKEWIYNTRPDDRFFLDITSWTTQFIYSEKEKMLILNIFKKDLKK